MYTPATRALVDRDFAGCVHNLTGLHLYSESQRVRGLPDIIGTTLERIDAASFSVAGNTVTTSDLGRPGTVTTLLYANGRWQITHPAT